MAELVTSETFYDLDCTKSNAVTIAVKEYKVEKALGICNNHEFMTKANRMLSQFDNARIISGDMIELPLGEADVIFFWSYNESAVSSMLEKFDLELKIGSRIISLWSPPGMVIPNKIDFPFFVCCTPFKYAKDVETQFKAIYGQECIDFTGAWMLGDKYIEAVEIVPSQYRRFLNILYSMIIWINAWNMDLACEEQVPPPIESYLGILNTFFNIDLSDMIERQPRNSVDQN